MTDLMHYEKGCSPSAIQRKYSLTYEQGYELAERLKKTQELELEVRRENENNNRSFMGARMNNYDILKEYEAHGEPLPKYEDYIKLKDLLEKAMDDVYQMSLVNEDSRELLMQIQEVLK